MVDKQTFTNSTFPVLVWLQHGGSMVVEVVHNVWTALTDTPILTDAQWYGLHASLTQNHVQTLNDSVTILVQDHVRTGLDYECPWDWACLTEGIHRAVVPLLLPLLLWESTILIQVSTRYMELDSNLFLDFYAYRTVKKYVLMFLNHSVCCILHYLFLCLFMQRTYICMVLVEARRESDILKPCGF